MADGGAWPCPPALQGHMAGHAPGPAATPIRSWTRCACGASTWPLQLYLCARCLSLEHTIATIQVTSRGNTLTSTAVVRGIGDFLAMAPSTHWHSAWRTRYLWWILCARESAFRRFTYVHGGLAGSVDRFTDVIDVIIAYVLQ